MTSSKVKLGRGRGETGWGGGPQPWVAWLGRGRERATRRRPALSVAPMVVAGALQPTSVSCHKWSLCVV